MPAQILPLIDDTQHQMNLERVLGQMQSQNALTQSREAGLALREQKLQLDQQRDAALTPLRQQLTQQEIQKSHQAMLESALTLAGKQQELPLDIANKGADFANKRAEYQGKLYSNLLTQENTREATARADTEDYKYHDLVNALSTRQVQDMQQKLHQSTLDRDTQEMALNRGKAISMALLEDNFVKREAMIQPFLRSGLLNNQDADLIRKAPPSVKEEFNQDFEEEMGKPLFDKYLALQESLKIPITMDMPGMPNQKDLASRLSWVGQMHELVDAYTAKKEAQTKALNAIQFKKGEELTVPTDDPKKPTVIGVIENTGMSDNHGRVYLIKGKTYNGLGQETDKDGKPFGSK